MKQRRSAVMWMAGASVLMLGLAQGGDPADARIACSNGYQMVEGAMLATPYCQDQLVAQVARQYGVAAPADKIRNNPNFKREVCRLIGHDIRIKETCDEVSPHGRGRF